MMRTKTCGELTKKDVGKKHTLCGWCRRLRKHGGINFIDLVDRYGTTQVVLDPKKLPASDDLKKEYTIQVEGAVKKRPKGMENKELSTGEVELHGASFKVLGESEPLPFEIDDRLPVHEDLRLKYRYLDLRRPQVLQKLALRHKMSQAVREYLTSQNFLEIETPIFVKPTPEGARDYLVPSRVNPGKFYALPQSPQLYKQILMISGVDRYFQLPRCMRDEDLRADRQPEFTQVDLEMSFVDVEDVLKVTEGILKHVMKKTKGIDLKTPLLRLTYEESMKKYGCDKPDLRFGLELTEITDICKKTNFQVLKNAELVKGLVVDKEFSRKELDSLTEFAKQAGAKGLVWVKITKGGFESPVAKFIDKKYQDEIVKKMKAKKGSTMFFVGDSWARANDVLSRLRVELGNRLGLIKENDYKFLFITDYPLFEKDEETNSWKPMHHIFSSPKEECIKYLEKDPSKVYAKLYDAVLNGVELGSGSIRIHDRKLQQKVLKVIGMPFEEVEQKFGFLMDSFKYGAVPHGGIALGFDRLVALLCGTHDIREVIAFPRNKAAQNPMDGSPSKAEPLQLKELNIKLDLPKQEKKEEKSKVKKK